jgi:hypothetical protein
MSRPHPRHVLFGTLALLAATCGRSWAQELVLRKGVSPVTDPISAVGADGVIVTSPVAGGGTPPSTLLPWDQVASVNGRFHDSASVYAKVADAAWRGRTRLERGDLAGAEPHFETLASTYAGRQGPMAQLVCGGLLLCRVGRGANSLAVQPFLGYLHACEGDPSPRQIVRGGGDVADPADMVPIDPVSRLCPALPPIWLTGPALQTSVNAEWKTFASRVSVIASLYRISQEAEYQDRSAQVASEPGTDDDSVRLLWEIVASRAGDAPVRGKAREALRARLNSQTPPPSWMAAWCRCAIGRSLLKESDDESQMLGVAELLAVPAVAEHAAPYVTGVCMAEAAVAMQRAGDAKGAAAIRDRLVEKFAGHPALDWEPMRLIGRVPSPAPAAKPAEGGGS